MRRIIALILVIVLTFTGCSATTPNKTESQDEIKENTTNIEIENNSIDRETEIENMNFRSLDDANLLTYLEDDIYASVENELATDDINIESVSSTYVSKEYINELEYNSKENIYFGYSLSELDTQFEGTRYIFSVEDGKTIVKPFEKYDYSYEKALLKDVAIGSGVVLICVTASFVATTVGAPSSVCIILSASAETAKNFAVSIAILSGIIRGTIENIRTGGDFDASFKAANTAVAKGFKWGAIAGAVTGGATKAFQYSKFGKTPTPRESELRALKKYGGNEQVSYFNGEKVASNATASTRPDVVRTVDGHLEAIEVKNYNLNSSNSRKTLYKELQRQISARVKHMPEGTTQRIVLDCKGRGYSEETIKLVVSSIQKLLADIYPNIPIDIMV